MRVNADWSTLSGRLQSRFNPAAAAPAFSESGDLLSTISLRLSGSDAADAGYREATGSPSREPLQKNLCKSLALRYCYPALTFPGFHHRSLPG